jgi:hypothetical protein
MLQGADLQIIAVASILALAIIVAVTMRGWSAYLAVRALDFESAPRLDARPRSSGHDLAELKERVRKLEAIASGLDS